MLCYIMFCPNYPILMKKYWWSDEPLDLEVSYSQADPCSPARLENSPAELAVSPRENLWTCEDGQQRMAMQVQFASFKPKKCKEWKDHQNQHMRCFFGG